MNENIVKKEKKEMKKSKKIIMIIIAAVVIIGLCVLGYFYYEYTHYFRTDNAKVSADTVTITPLLTGNVLSWNVKEGTVVSKDQILGRQDTSLTIASNNINVSTMNNTADLIMSKANIKSPIDGKVIQSNVIEGETVSPGMQLAIVADTNNTYIVANIEETDIFKIKEGQTVDITIDAYPGKTFTGYVRNITQASQTAFSTFASLNTSGTYSKVTQLIPVKISIVNDEKLPMLLGMNAVVKIHLS